MQFELSKLLESALEEEDDLDKIRQINKVFKIINDCLPIPEKFRELAKDTFLIKNLILCRPYHQNTVDLILSMLESYHGASRQFTLNYLKSICEVVSISETGEGYSNADYTVRSSAIANTDRAKLKEMTLDQFKSEVRVSVNKISDKITMKITETKFVALQKIVDVVALIQKVSIFLILVQAR
jgi:hypothetical protein